MGLIDLGFSLFVVFILIGFYLCIWFDICNKRTKGLYADLTHFIHKDMVTWEKYKGVLEVNKNYDRNLWEHMKFGNPKRFYPDEFIEEFEEWKNNEQ